LLLYERNLHEEIENLQRDEIRISQNLKNFSMQIQNNEGQLRNEESKLSSTRREISDGQRKKKTLELENVEGGSTDVLALVLIFFLSVPSYLHIQTT
jgi:septal ring factor EnvC (AmiA/AmiB activator)